MQITAQLVKQLRDKTGAGMMKCKEALAECGGNLEEAVDFLRKKGLASADKRSGRATSQGLVVPTLSEDKRTIAIVESNCETDFVAKTDDFINFANKLSQHLLANPSVKTLADFEQTTIDGMSVDELRKNVIAKVGENISISRAERIEVPADGFGLFDTYIHNEGKLAVVVQVSSENADAARSLELANMAHEVALQAAAMKPLYTFSTDVPTEILAREREVVLGQIKNDPKNADKPEEIVNKIVDGRLNKYCKEFCLVEQAYVKNDSKTVKDLATDLSKKLGTKIEIVTFRRWAVGEAPANSGTEEKQAEAAS